MSPEPPPFDFGSARSPGRGGTPFAAPDAGVGQAADVFAGPVPDWDVQAPSWGVMTPDPAGGTEVLNNGYAQAPTAVSGAQRPPIIWLIAGVTGAAVGLVVAVVYGSNPALAIAAWFLAGPLAICLLAAFMRANTRSSANAVYKTPAWVAWSYAGAMLVTLAGVVVSAVQIALWIGRL